MSGQAANKTIALIVCLRPAVHLTRNALSDSTVRTAMNDSIYRLDGLPPDRLKQVEDWLVGLDKLSSQHRNAAVQAWTSAWCSSSYATLEDMPFAPGVDYPLKNHVNEVTRIGLDLARRAGSDWNLAVDEETLAAILILHDVDKPLLFVREEGEVRYSNLHREFPHGVLGAMILKDLGFASKIVSAVALHAGYSPYHASTFEGYVLHYADHFSADHALMSLGMTPLYQPRRS